jgi:hypothetical protein
LTRCVRINAADTLDCAENVPDGHEKVAFDAMKGLVEMAGDIVEGDSNGLQHYEDGRDDDDAMTNVLFEILSRQLSQQCCISGNHDEDLECSTSYWDDKM